jgi:hypothetical protein
LKNNGYLRKATGVRVSDRLCISQMRGKSRYVKRPNALVWRLSNTVLYNLADFVCKIGK